MDHSKGRVDEQAKGMSTKNILAGSFATVVAFLAVGCGSAEPTSNSAANSATYNANRQVAVVANANEVNDPNAAVSNAQSPANKVMQRIEQMRAEAANKPNDPNAGKTVRSGPENSTITIQLTDHARETRVFNKHPTLLSVEKVHDGKEGQVNITMRDGRKATLKGDAVLNIETVTSEQILAMVKAAAESTSETKEDLNRTRKP
jgi:hypothetical protein